MQDPVRKEVPEAVATCVRAGILVRMVTGDNIHTARRIARECGILTEGGLALEGPKFREMSEEQIVELLPRLQVVLLVLTMLVAVALGRACMLWVAKWVARWVIEGQTDLQAYSCSYCLCPSQPLVMHLTLSKLESFTVTQIALARVHTAWCMTVDCITSIYSLCHSVLPW